jgi:peptidyl-prolyl cis-trans isomerase SurA
MLDRLQLHLKQKAKIGKYIFLYMFCVLFSLESTAALELEKKATKHLNIGSNNANSAVSAPETDKIKDEPERIGVVATVNGEPVTVMDILEVCGLQESRLPHMFKGAQLKEEVKKLRLKALDEVIDRKLVYQEFKEKGYQLPKEFVEENMDHLMQNFNVNNRQELEKLLKARGSTMAEFREKVYENVAVDLLINERSYMDINITPKYVYDYYVKHKGDFTSPKQIRLQVLKLKTDGIHKDELNTISTHLKNLLKNKNKFADAVLLYSEGPNIEHAGDIGWIDMSKLRKDFLEYVKDLDSGDVTGPIKLKEAYYFLRVADIKQEKVQSFKQAKKSIKDEMMRERKEKGYKTYIEDLRSKAYIKEYL